MDELGFIGFVDIDGTLPFHLICRNGSDVPTAPDAAPTWATYLHSSTSSVQTGTLGAADNDSKTGFRIGTLTASSGTYVAGTMYTVIFQYAISSTSHTAKGSFLVN